MLTALLAAKNIVGEQHDIWNVNVERSYHENFTNEEWSKVKQDAQSTKDDSVSLSRVA